MKKILVGLLIIFIVGVTIGWVLSAPQLLTAPQIAAFPDGDAKSGEMVFWAGGCSSCHAKPKSKDEAKFLLAGGMELKTPFGTFVVPNISPDKLHGIGNWSLAEFANAMKLGVSPDGSHYYPAFPYSSYSRMNDKDVADLWAFLNTLPTAAQPSKNHDLSFPFNIRRGLGLWKRLYLDPSNVIELPAAGQLLLRGQYLVEGTGHCGECHTPRNPIGGPDNGRWLAGGTAPEGNGKIPNITPHAKGLGGWSEKDIVYALETGFTPEFDSFGSSMAAVQENMAKLPATDREAIAAYLKAIPAVEN